MQFTTISAAAILAFAAGISALPAPNAQVTLKIFNDQTGANAEATISASGTAYSLTDLFAGSAIDTGNGNLLGTSAQLTKFQDTTQCQLINLNIPDYVIDIDGRAKNFVDLDGDVTRPLPIWLNGFTFSCAAAW
jgi:hypothetical protein